MRKVNNISIFPLVGGQDVIFCMIHIISIFLKVKQGEQMQELGMHKKQPSCTVKY